MEEKKNYQMQEIYDQATDDIDDRIKWCEKEEEDYEIDDLITEVADNNIPIYTYDLLQYASNDFDLIQPNDLCSDSPSVTQIITSNIYEVLIQALYEYINEQDKE